MPSQEKVEFSDIAAHVGHHLICVDQGPFGAPHTVLLRCMSCNMDIISLENPGLNPLETVADQGKEDKWSKDAVLKRIQKAEEEEAGGGGST